MAIPLSADAGAGDDVILGGRGDETITAGSGNDIVLGDNGAVGRGMAAAEFRADEFGIDRGLWAGPANYSHDDSGSLAVAAHSWNAARAWYGITTLAEEQGGVDTITGGDGEDILFGGSAGDTLLDGGPGRDIILGDNGDMDRRIAPVDVGTVSRTIIDGSGAVTAATLLTPVWFSSRAADLEGGGEALIAGGYGGDFLLGGIGSDTLITGGEGVDVIIGDHGAAEHTNYGYLARVRTLFPEVGFNDEISGGIGHDILIGGTGGDRIEGGRGEEIILGDNGVVVRADGRVWIQIQSVDPNLPKKQKRTG